MLITVVFAATLLVACGETATPAATTTVAAATTVKAAVTTTIAATTAMVATTAPATTTAAVATTAIATTTAAVATTAIATTTAAVAVTTTAGANTGASAPTIPGTTEIVINPAIQGPLQSGFATSAPGVSDLSIKVFSSDDDPDTLVGNVDKAFMSAGYAFGIPGATKAVKSGNSSLAYYAKAGAPDSFLIIGDPNKDLVAGLDAKTLQLIAPELGGKKSALFLVTGTGLIKALGAAGGATTTTAAAGATTTAASATTAATGTDGTLAVKGTTEVTLSALVGNGLKTGFQGSAPGVTDLSFRLFGSDDDVDTLVTNADTSFTGGGYAFAIPGATKPIKQGDANLGFYSKSSSPDLFVIIGDPNKGLGVAGLDASNLQIIAPELKSKKSVMILVTGTGLIKALQSAGAGSTAPSASPTP